MGKECCSERWLSKVRKILPNFNKTTTNNGCKETVYKGFRRLLPHCSHLSGFVSL
jgi:hypothetical protein